MRDRRWDFLYDREKQPVRAYVLGRFAGELAGDLGGWPRDFAEWVPEELLARWRAGLESRPPDRVLRLALRLASLELRREFELAERVLDRDGPAAWQTEAERAAGHLAVRYVTERCLALKEHADPMKLSREELAGAVELAERKLFSELP